MHSNYGGSILDYDADDLDNMCADVVEGFLAGPTRYGLGEWDPYMDNYYDERSHIDKALGTYNGSIYWVQGLRWITKTALEWFGACRERGLHVWTATSGCHWAGI